MATQTLQTKPRQIGNEQNSLRNASMPTTKEINFTLKNPSEHIVLTNVDKKHVAEVQNFLKTKDLNELLINNYFLKYLKKYNVKISQISNLKFSKDANIIPYLDKNVVLKNCIFEKNSEFHFQGESLTCFGCTFQDNTMLHTTNNNAHVTLYSCQLPKKIAANIKGNDRILQRERALKFVGKIKNLELTNCFDSTRSLGGLIDTELAKIEDENGNKTFISFKDGKGNLIDQKALLTQFGGSLIRKGNLSSAIINAQIAVKRNSDESLKGKSDDEVISKCIISKEEQIVRTVSNIDNVETWKNNVREQAKNAKKYTKDKSLEQDSTILESLDEVKTDVTRLAFLRGLNIKEIKNGIKKFTEETNTLVGNDVKAAFKFIKKQLNFFKKEDKKQKNKESNDNQANNKEEQNALSETSKENSANQNSDVSLVEANEDEVATVYHDIDLDDVEYKPDSAVSPTSSTVYNQNTELTTQSSTQDEQNVTKESDKEDSTTIPSSSSNQDLPYSSVRKIVKIPFRKQPQDVDDQDVENTDSTTAKPSNADTVTQNSETIQHDDDDLRDE